MTSRRIIQTDRRTEYMIRHGDSIVASRSAQLSADLGSEFVILGAREELYYGVDGVGARIWELIQEPRTVSFLVETISAEYEVDPERCAKDVEVFLDELSRRSLVEVSRAAIP